MQSWEASEYSEKAAFVSDLGLPVLDLLKVQPGEKILDLGCGDGTLALQIQSMGAFVTAVDASDSMVAVAKKKGLNALVMNGENLDFELPFDAVFSNAALHWMQDYRSVIDGVYRALKPVGRFVGELGGMGNIQVICKAMKQVYAEHPEFCEFQMPWYFPSAEDYAEALEQGGFRVNSIELFPRPTPVASGLQAWLKLFLQKVIASFTPEQEELF